MQRKSVESVEREIRRHGQAALDRFIELKELFGDVQ
jgi:hypothetical protein